MVNQLNDPRGGPPWQIKVISTNNTVTTCWSGQEADEQCASMNATMPLHSRRRGPTYYVKLSWFADTHPRMAEKAGR